jgi:alpha-methylacyl-CoA racemase
MMLADMGAAVLMCERLGQTKTLEGVDILSRGKDRLRLDLKSDEVRTAVVAMLPGFDIILEGFRPGTVERLGLAPDVALAVNPRLVYARMSGYGQGNTYSAVTGHDVNFVAMGSALAHIGPDGQPPQIPLNLVGDFGGGGMLLAVGALSALFERERSGQGQVIDVAMTDAVGLLMAGLYGMRAGGRWSQPRGANLVDGGAPFYNVYETRDGRFVSVGAIEPKHYAELLRVCELDAGSVGRQHDQSLWAAMKARFAQVFRTRTQAEWCAAFAGVEACFAPALSMDNAPAHRYHRERGSFPVIDGIVQPGPAPRFSRTASHAGSVPADDRDVRDVLRRAGLDAALAEDLSRKGLVE